MSDAKTDKTEGAQVEKSEAEWKQELSPQQYRVLREQGTEPPFTGKYWNEHADGVYRCAACGNPLFDAATKFESGTGWPSFYEPIEGGHVSTEDDRSHFMRRTSAAR